MAFTDREKYSAYLCSREWAEKRRAVMARAGGRCERCKINAPESVHHLTYERKYNEKLTDLAAWCQACHEFTHGHSDKDPAAPPKFYLAGKIEKMCWRHFLVPHLREYNWLNQIIVGGIPAFGRACDYVGPFFTSCSHGCFHGPTTHGCVTNGCGSDDPLMPGHKTDREEVTVQLCVKAIKACDILFAWIDAMNCYGTIAEIGVAHTLGKKIWIGWLNETIQREMWFLKHLADFEGVFDYPPIAFSAACEWAAMMQGQQV